jgi:glycosyltransferase involved in cell wall biosynthesis
MSDEPRVSVAMNAHNSTEYLREALESALAQSMDDLEIVIWDNASTELADAIAESMHDARIRYIYTAEKTSLYQARCDLVRACRGEYVAFLDCDDLWAVEKLTEQVGAMEATTAVASCSDYEFFYEGSAEPREYFRAYDADVVSLRDALLPYGVGMSCLVARRDVLLEVLPDPVPDWFFIEDLDMVSRLLGRGDMAVVRRPLMSYRFHGSNASRDRGAYVREVSAWVQDLQDRAVDQDTRRVLTKYYRTQALRSHVAQLVASGRRLEAARAWRQMPWTVTKAKWAVGLVAPRSVAARLA